MDNLAADMKAQMSSLLERKTQFLPRLKCDHDLKIIQLQLLEELIYLLAVALVVPTALTVGSLCVDHLPFGCNESSLRH